MELVVERGRGYVSAVQNKQRRPGDRPHPGRLDLLAGAQGDLQGRGDPCRAAHRLRPADHRRRDQAVDASRATPSPRPARPWSSCSAWPASSTSTPRASTSARRPTTQFVAEQLATADRGARPDGALVQLPQARGHPHRGRAHHAQRGRPARHPQLRREVDRRGQGQARRAWAWPSRTARPGSTRRRPCTSTTTTTRRTPRTSSSDG